MTPKATRHSAPRIVASCHGIDVPDAPHLGPGMIEALNNGSYERRELEAARAVIAPGATVLELGAGSGFVGAAIARNCKAERVLSFEANPSLLPHIGQLYAINDLNGIIEARHAVVLAEPDAPDSVTFHVRGNFLGSGLTVVKNPQKAVPVDVPVVRYAKLKQEFPHDTIVMDIEGAEQAFLTHADLAGVDTVIFEIHRQIYGREGMKACRRALNRAGFAIDPEASRGGVHVWRRERDGEAPDPSGSDEEVLRDGPGEDQDDAAAVLEDRTFSGRIERIADAVVVPERPHDAELACGVIHQDGRFCDLSRGWIRAFKATGVPTIHPGEPIETLSGRHLFAGHMRGHFGHFLVESTARLWALSNPGLAPDSILFLPYMGKPKAAEQALAAHRTFFDCLGIDVPIGIVKTATLVEDLLVPELGFGWRARFAGSPAYRSFMREKLGEAAAPEGSEMLYVSRTRLPAEKGGLVGEAVIEENLASMGYEVFHPQKHDLRTQIARYRAARKIVALDGSALHLAAYVAAPETRVAIILRRSKANHADYTLQYRSFAGITPDIVDAIRTDWAGGANPKSNFRSVGEADFEEIFRTLARLGYIPRDARPDLPDNDARVQMIMDLADRRSDGLRPI